MQLDAKTLETVAIAISVAAGCEPCTRYHVEAAAKYGASRFAMMHMVALAAVQQEQRTPARVAVQRIAGMPPVVAGAEPLEPASALASIGVAVCMNAVRPLRDRIETARSYGVTDQEIIEVVALAERIKQKAASHLDRVIDRLDADRDAGGDVVSLCT